MTTYHHIRRKKVSLRYKLVVQCIRTGATRVRGLICRNKARGVTLSVIFLARTCEAKRYCSRPTNCISELGQRGVGMQGLVRGCGYILQAIARGVTWRGRCQCARCHSWSSCWPAGRGHGGTGKRWGNVRMRAIQYDKGRESNIRSTQSNDVMSASQIPGWSW